jgi:uncharacterized protein (TIGR02231 family)
MKRSSLVALLVGLLGLTPSLAAQSVPSQIRSVTLFSDQALVQRHASAAVEPGLNEILLEVDAFEVDRESVTARVFGAGEIYSVQFKESAAIEPPQDKIRELTRRVAEFQRERRKRIDQKQGLQKIESFLNAFVDFSKSQIPKDLATRAPKPEELNQTLSFLSANYQNVYGELQTVDDALSSIEKELQVLESELDALRTTDRRTVKTIEIVFNAAKKQKVDIDAQYIALNARWQPLYKVSVPPELSAVDLTLFSSVTQKTGEDWQQVNLSISNVIPLRGVELPTLGSWTLDLPRPLTAGRVRSKAVGLQSPAPAMESVAADAVAEAPPEEAGFVQAERRQLPFSFEYAIPRPVSIASRDKDTLLPVFSKTLTGRFYHFAVPRMNALTFLVADVDADKELLSGMLNVYFGGRYVGRTLLGEKKAGETFTLGLGADREVAVKREKIRDLTRETFFGKFDRSAVVRELAFKITAENLKDKPAHLKILDAVPISRTDRIEVKEVTLTPKPAQENYLDRQGVMLCELDLAPGRSADISVAFAVSYPKDNPPPEL